MQDLFCQLDGMPRGRTAVSSWAGRCRSVASVLGGGLRSPHRKGRRCTRATRRACAVARACLGPTLTSPAVCGEGPPWTPDHPLSPNLPLLIRRVGAQRRRRQPRADGHSGARRWLAGIRKRCGRWHGARTPDRAGGPRPGPAEARTVARYEDQQSKSVLPVRGVRPHASAQHCQLG